MLLSAAPPLVASAGVFGALNLLGLAISQLNPTFQYHLDLLGTGSFAVAAFFIHGASTSSLVSAAAVGLWATKLASFLLFRVLMVKTDLRLEETLSSSSGRIGFWLISFLWGVLVSLPHTLASGVAAAPAAAEVEQGVTAAATSGFSLLGLGPVQLAGVALFLMGFFLETAADLQKWFFKGDPSNKGKFCDVGVWRLSQHPNWAGKLLIWSGIFVLNAPFWFAISR